MCFLCLIKLTVPYMEAGDCRRLFAYYKRGSRLYKRVRNTVI